MSLQEQAAVAAFLASPQAYGGTQPVDHVETHCAHVFLVGERAYKMKKAVRFSYLDFSTRERRHAALEAELAVNRANAPALYRRVLAVTCDAAGALALEGDGTPVEWLLEMARFPDEARLDRWAARRGLDPALLDRLADAVAAAHARAPRVAAARRDIGGSAGMARVLASNAAELASLTGAVFDAESVAGLTRAMDEAWRAQAQRLDQRRAMGFVRRCHGDLHLANIAIVEGAPVLFDAIEFSEDIATIDVFYDLAFLLMDLLERGQGGPANRVLNRYLDASPWTDAPAMLDGLALLPFFLAARATVRAHVTGRQAGQGPTEARQAARAYLAAAQRHLAPPLPRIVALGGFSGCGKSTVARHLAPALGAPPGAVILRSDALRKRLWGVPLEMRLPAEAYAPAVNTQVYGALYESARRALGAGRAVILDAVFARPEERAAAAGVAAASGAPFAGFWLDAPASILRARIEARRGDVSDATLAVLEAQLRRDRGALDWTLLDATPAVDRVAEAAAAALGLTLA